MKQSAKIAAGLGLWGLVGVVVSSMVGSGVYSLPQNMAQGASVGAIVIAWVITGIGMYFVAETFRLLSKLKPHMTSGIYTYAQDGFGPVAGFCVAWGYWLCNIFANTGYAVILMESLNYFFPPYFAGGNNIWSFLVSTGIVWGFFFLTTKGIKTAASVNLVGTICKLIPIAIFILAALIVFKLSIILPALKESLSIGNLGFKSVLGQIKSTMLITLWSFIGIETAVALSDRAKKQADVSKATLIAFVFCLTIYMLISLLPFGILPRETIASYANPSTAGILEHILGKGGGLIMVIGLMVSVLFSWLSWFIVSAEVPYAASKNGANFPAQFCRENKKGAPIFSLCITAVMTQLALLLAFFSENAWNTMLSITAVMVMPVYILTTVYLWKISRRHRFPRSQGIVRGKSLITAVLGTVYAVWLVYAANIKYLIMALIFFALGIPVYLLASKQRNRSKECAK